jgi:thiosulfate reductase/polysulfide reductase chain A
VNPLVASEKGVAHGEYVRLANPEGTVSNRIRVRVTERIGTDSVFMAHGFGHRSQRLRLTYGLGADDSELMSNVKVDPLMGGTGMRTSFVTIVKEST